MSYGYIYKTENLMNGVIYIGQKKGSFKNYYLGSGQIIKKAIIKYGKEAFRVDVVILAKNKKQLDKYEIKLISYFRKKVGEEYLYNIAAGGSNEPYLYQTGRTRFKKGMTPWNKGKKIQTNTGRTHFVKGSHISEIHKKRISMATKGEKNPFFGKKHSEEALNIMRKTWFKPKCL